ncbi:MAG: preprotein translocase subunit YajC [Sulfurimonas sp.]|jgi:preprotein translocase subunit YajC|nr:preprotein translocase subunit YajC [Sulfurimonadaceae bacterium]
MDILAQLLPFVFLIAIMYFVIIRPQQNEAKRKKEMIASLKKGDKVITNGGVLATIYKVEDDFFSIKINDDVVIKILKDAIAKKQEDEK